MKRIAKIVLMLFVLSLVYEGFIKDDTYPMLPNADDSISFKYAYGDIYKKLYKKKLKNGQYVYSSQRQYFSDYKDFPVAKSPDSIRIFFIGGSVCYDWAENTTLPVDLIPGKKLEIINACMPGYDSYRVKIIAKEIMNYDPDLVVLLSGNNEYYSQQGINLKAYYSDKFLTRFWLLRTFKKHFSGINKEVEFNRTPNENKLYFNYENNIRNIAVAANDKNIPIVLCTLPLNVTGSVPDIPMPINKQFIRGKNFLDNGYYEKAITYLNEFRKHNPGNLFGNYFLGRAYEKHGEHKEAKVRYSAAQNLMISFDTSNSMKNEIVRKIAKEEGDGLFDLEEVFFKISPNGLTDYKQFRDHCHIWEEYLPFLDRSFIETVIKNNKINSKFLDSSKGIEKLQEYAANITSLTFKEITENEKNWRIITSHAVFNSIQANNRFSERSLLFFEALFLMDPSSLWNIQYAKKEIKAFLSEDPYSRETILHDNLFDENWTRVLAHVGETYRIMQKYQEALVYFNQSIEYNQEDYTPFLGRALTYSSLNKKTEAKENIKKALVCKETNLEEIYMYKEILGL